MNAEDILKYGNITMMTTLEKIPDTEWDRPDVCGWWSCRQITAHLASFELVLVEVLDSLLGKAPGVMMRRMGDVDYDFNLHEVSSRDGDSAATILAEYESAHRDAMARVRQIPVSERRIAGALPWYGQAYDLEDYLVYTYYAHKREHMAQVNVFLDTLKA